MPAAPLPGRASDDQVRAAPLDGSDTHGTRWLLPAEASSVRVAPELAVAQLRCWGFYLDGATAQNLRQIVSEITTNAVLYGEGQLVALTLAARHEEVFLETMDSSTVQPVSRDAADEDENGRGLFIVRTLALAWGIHNTPHGKGVWATVGLPPQPRDYHRRELLMRLVRASRPRPQIHVHQTVA